MMMEHTPGAWEFSDDFAEVQEQATGRPLAKMDNREDYSDWSQETITNGVLMAAAPELLAALWYAVAQADHSDACIADEGYRDNRCQCWKSVAWAAIQKASGT